MPIIDRSTYQAPILLRNPHFQTIFASLARKVGGVNYTRERIGTPDGDFLDLDFSLAGFPRIAVLTHGLEGSSRSSHVLGAVKALNSAGWDAVAWNFRGCSGEPNRLLKSYHSGSTDDLETVLRHLESLDRWNRISLIGFSIGGNLILKYLGEAGDGVRSILCGAVAFSVPCDLKSSAERLSEPANAVYLKDFMRCLRAKVRAKMPAFRGEVDDRHFSGIRSFKDYDDRYTAPIHGFADAEDYWRRCSCNQFLPSVKLPSLIVNALDDPFLGEKCFPAKEAERSRSVHLETPRHGGHLGFMAVNKKSVYWSEARVLAFLDSL